MIDQFKKNITLGNISKDSLNVAASQDTSDPRVQSDLILYREFIRYFENLEYISEHNMVIGISFAYAWMPTIFDLRPSAFDTVLTILNSAKNGNITSANDLTILKNCFNNSLVGTTKLLHFINPNCFAIWDSRVYSYLTSQEPYFERLSRPGSYLDYLQFCGEITSMSGYAPIHSSLVKKIGYDVTPFRSLELIMYTNGGVAK